MARLIVDAIVEDYAAAPGNLIPLQMGVSVTDNLGVPVVGLLMANFQTSALLIAPGGPAAPLTGVVAGVMPGTYILQLTPPAAWVLGEYAYAVRVIAGPDQGTKLAGLLVN
jgi:hypothetical protein